MKSLCSAFVIIVATVILAHPLTITSQWNKKPYTEWSEKETLKLLDDSPWSQKQSFTDTSKNFSVSRGQTTIADLITVNFHVRFFSAKPLRQATCRFMELQQKGKMSDQMAAGLKALASADFPDYIIVTVTVDSDRASNLLQQSIDLLHKLTTSELKNDSYLVISSGQRVFLKEFQPPRNDGLGARFVFPRLVDGKPFITPESGEILFHSTLAGGNRLNSTVPDSDIVRNGFTLNTRHKVKDMMFDGKLEY